MGSMATWSPAILAVQSSGFAVNLDVLAESSHGVMGQRKELVASLIWISTYSETFAATQFGWEFVRLDWRYGGE